MVRLFGWVAIAAVLAFFFGSAVIVLGAAVMWLFVFGDDPWPGYSGALLGGMALVVGLSIFAGSLAFGLRSAHFGGHAGPAKDEPTDEGRGTPAC